MGWAYKKLPGDSSPDEIIRSLDRGLLVEKMGGGQVNTVNGDFVFEVGPLAAVMRIFIAADVIPGPTVEAAVLDGRDVVRGQLVPQVVPLVNRGPQRVRAREERQWYRIP